MRVGWIGLGRMGLRTAKKVAAAGHRVVAFDIKPPKPDDAQGLILAGSAREAAEGCELLCVAVFSDDQVEDLLIGKDDLFHVLRPRAVVAVFTTGTIASARKVAAAAPPGIAVLDTCFSNRLGDGILASGMMNLLVGGDAAALERCRPALEPFARAIYHLGDSGAGRAMKLVNNLLWVAQTPAGGRRPAPGRGARAGAVRHGPDPARLHRRQ
jgi:3-hydroxyisobutyrate dehydrogenase-like beta-hydroxyacid dehydrogenase